MQKIKVPVYIKFYFKRKGIETMDLMVCHLADLIKKRDELEEASRKNRKDLKNTAMVITAESLEDRDYETAKVVAEVVFRYAPGSPHVEAIRELLSEKKAEKFPAMRKPTYYPEIDQLGIPEEDKLKLDKAARANVQRIMRKENIGKLPVPMAWEELELLESVGVAERYVEFKCADCGFCVGVISASNLSKYARFWELEKVERPSQAEQQEMSELYERGYGEVELACDRCDFYKEICSEEELERYNCREEFFRIAKDPDLTYEKM